MIGWIANALNITGLILLGRKKRIGWLFGIVAECLWIWRANQVGGLGDLVFISAVYVLVAAWNFWGWGCKNTTFEASGDDMRGGESGRPLP